MAKVLVIRQSYYGDLDVQRKIDALVDSGHEVDVICLRRPGERLRERLGPISVHRVPLPHRRGGTAAYLAKYGAFLAIAATLAGALQVRRRYAVVEAYSMPDVLVFAALVPKLLGAKVLLTLLETMPEFFATKFERGLDNRAVRLVSAAEQASIRFADHVVTCTDEMREAFVARGARTPITVVLNSADESIFSPGRVPRVERPGEFTVVCHGTIEERYGLDTLVRAAALTRHEIPELRVLIFGEGDYRDALVALTAELAVEDRVTVAEDLIALDELVGTIEAADAGVVAMKRDAFRELTQTNKMFEFISLGVPQAVSRLRSVENSFDAQSFAWFEPADPEDLARALRELHADPARARALAAHAAQVAEPYRWPHQRGIYLQAIGGLLGETVLQEGFGRRVELEGDDVVRKTFVDGPPGERRARAAAELGRLERFAAALRDVPGATCPEPLGAIDDPPGFRMRRVAGEEVLDVLGSREVDAARISAVAEVVAAALVAYVEAVGEPYRDLKLDNVLQDATGTLVFLDVGDPQDADAGAPGDSAYEVSVGNLVASLIFESARPRRLAARRLHRRSSALAVAIVEALRARGVQLRPDRLAAATRRDYVRSTFGRHSPVRTAWYATVGWAAGARVPLPGGPVGPLPVWRRAP